MNHPEHLDKAGRKIPLNATCRKWMGNALYDRLARIRRDAGVGPDRYPPVENDIQYDITKAQMGAEMAARETADLILPAILTGTAPRRRHRIAAALRHPLLAATTVIAGMIATALIVHRDFQSTATHQQQFLQNTKFVMDQLKRAVEDTQTVTNNLQQLASEKQFKTIQETTGKAILSTKPLGLNTKIGPGILTISLPDKFTLKRGADRFIEIKHGLTPDEYESLKQSLDAIQAK
ncbi:MAG: hypothetical protein WCP45_08265 [Verrucomicrobiota bacterium]